MTDPAILSRIQKLLALSRGVANEHEAALAGEKVRQLLEEHNLSLLDVDREEPETGEAAVRISVARQAYETILANAAAKLCDCAVIEIPQWSASWYGRRQLMLRELRFCGIAINARASLELFLYLRVEVKRLWSERSKGFRSTQRKHYLAGAALRIKLEVAALKEAQASAHSLAIVRIGNSLAKRHLEQNYPGMRVRKVGVDPSRAAFNAGYEDGGDVELQPKRKALPAAGAA